MEGKSQTGFGVVLFIIGLCFAVFGGMLFVFERPEAGLPLAWFGGFLAVVALTVEFFSIGTSLRAIRYAVESSLYKERPVPVSSPINPDPDQVLATRR